MDPEKGEKILFTMTIGMQIYGLLKPRAGTG